MGKGDTSANLTMTHQQKVRKATWLAALASVIALGIAVSFFLNRETQYEPHPLETSFYVWQEAWGDVVAMSVINASGDADSYMIFAAEVKTDRGELRLAPKRPDWKALADAGMPVVLCVRIGVQFAEHLKLAGTESAARELAAMAKDLMDAAQTNGVHPTGVQWDYDCPTSRVGDYADLMEAMRKHAPETEFSITALPDWLSSSNFVRLAHAVSWYVLQVHGLERPRTISDPARICDVGRVRAWTDAANKLGVPYYLALPTYTHRLYYDATGKYLGLGSEGAPEGRGVQTRDAVSDPDEMLAILADLRDRTPRHLRGIVWFRLPVETDRMNWTWAEMKAVLAGRPPTVEIIATIKSPKENLYEVWITNKGERNVSGNVTIPVSWSGGAPVAWDAMGDFRSRSSMNQLIGPAPRSGEEKLAAWYRVTGTSGSISVQKAEFHNDEN